ncbi:MAG TPA: glycosyltransferase, partial [Candidatus Limnocylindrales bacterium]
GDWISNAELRRYYSSAAIVLNDHWQDMRDEGFFSNRLYDALASGAFVVSDHVPGIEEEFDNGLVTYRRKDELIAVLDRYLADPEARRDVARRGRAAVLSRHTFGHRAETILDAAKALLAEQATAVSVGPTPARLD